MMTSATDVYLSRDEVACEDASGAGWHHTGGSLDACLDALIAHLGAIGAPRRVRLWLGAALCRPVLIPAIAGARSRQERTRMFEAMAVAESGLTAPCRIGTSGPGQKAATFAVVVEEDVLAVIERRLSGGRLRALSIRPWWDHVLASALRSNAGLRAFAVWEGRALTVLMGEGAGFSSARTSYPVDALDTAHAAVARALVSAMVAPADTTAVMLDWSATASRADARALSGETVFAAHVARMGSAS